MCFSQPFRWPDAGAELGNTALRHCFGQSTLSFAMNCYLSRQERKQKKDPVPLLFDNDTDLGEYAHIVSGAVGGEADLPCGPPASREKSVHIWGLADFAVFFRYSFF